MRAVEITMEDIEMIKHYLRTKKCPEGVSAGTRSFIRHHSSQFFLGGETLYRKTSNGSRKVLGPTVYSRFQECLSDVPACYEPVSSTPADHSFESW